MTDNPCNCSTCLHKDNDWCEKLNRILRWHEVGLISELGCASHSQAREKTLNDVLLILHARAMIDENNQYYLWLEDAECAVESLRTKEQP